MVSPTHSGIASAIVGPVVALLEQLGFDARRGFAGLERYLAGPYVPGPLADDVLDAAAAALARPAIGLDVGGMLPIGYLGLIDYTFATSASVRDALRRVARIYGVASQRTALALIEQPPHASLTFTRRPGAGRGRHWIELTFAAFTQRLRATTGHAFRCERVSFRHAAPPTSEPYQELFGGPVAFAQEEDRLALSCAVLELPLHTAVAPLARLLEDHVRALAPIVAADPSWLAHTRLAIVDLLDRGELGLEALAAQLRLGRRTLQRELARHGTSHKALVDDVRRERALALLGRGDLTVTEVAARLAFAEPSSFFRAFRRWTGTSPRTFIR